MSQLSNEEARGAVPISLAQSMELAGQNLLNALAPSQGYLPFFNLRVNADYAAEYRFGWPAHNLGRWWDAILRLEEATAFRVPGDLEQAMLGNVHRYFENPDSICIGPNSSDRFELHSLREGLLALHALVRYRDDAWAKKTGRAMIATLLRTLRADGSWDFEAFQTYSAHPDRMKRHMDPAGSHGRMIEALVWFYQATGDSAALDLAQRSAEYHFANSTQADGGLNLASKPDHTHSYFGTLRGLLLFGALTRQHAYIERVAATYRETVRRLVRESGFTAHDLGEGSGGETSSPGDAAQLALWLSLHGYGEFLDDAERLLRVRLLPSQIIESPPLRPAKDDGGDEHARLNERVIGGYGGCHTEPHGGKQCFTDVTAAGLHTVVDLYRHVVRRTDQGWEVLLHMNYEAKGVSIRSERAAEAKMIVQLSHGGPLAIRIPGWTPRESVALEVAGQRLGPVFTANFVHLNADRPKGAITLRYALPVRTTSETISGVDYHYQWKGDEIVGVTPNTDFYPFYPPMGTR